MIRKKIKHTLLYIHMYNDFIRFIYFQIANLFDR